MFDKRSPFIARVHASLILACILVVAGAAQTGNSPGESETRVSDLTIVVVKADLPSQSLGELYKMLKAERAKGPTELQVLVGGIEVNIGPEPKPPDEMPLHPHPLLLTVHADAKGNLDLNNEKRGSLANLDPVTRRLKQVFKEREDTGVFREGRNEIEKTVSIRAHESLKVSDLDKIVTMLDTAGSDRINLLIDPEPEPDPDRFIGLPVPRIPKKKRKP